MTDEETPTQEVEKEKRIITNGAIYRICKPIFKQKECRLSPEYAVALSKYVEKLIADIARDTTEVTLSRNKKTASVEDLKAVGEKRGFLVE